jgi:hypothetical protein
MRSLRSGLLLEGTLQVRSVWTLVLVATLAAALLMGSYSTLGWAKSMRPSLESMRAQEGSQFPSWLLHSEDALPFRSDLATLQPRMGVNLWLTIAGAIAPLLAAIWGARAVGSEFGQRTARVRAANDGWTRVVALKQMLLALAAIAVVILVLLLGIGSGHVVWALFSAQMPDLSSIVLPSPWFSPWLGAIAVALGAMVYGLLGCLTALVTRSTAAGIVLSVAVPYAEGYTGAWWLPRAAYGYLLERWLTYHDGSFIAAPGMAHAPASPAVALSVMAAWLAVFAGGALLLSRRQEIP